MGTTLDNGIYLPDEGERNCYDGLAGNWVALDNHLGSTDIHVTINDKQAWDGHVADTTIHVTSADKQAWNGHIADSVKHVTAEDKQAWNSKADASALTAHTGNTTIHVTAEDKAKWDAVTSKADDSDVVHKSGDETISGQKTFRDQTLVYNPDNTANTPNIILKNSRFSRGSSTELDTQYIRFTDKSSKNCGQLSCYGNSAGNTLISLFASNTDSNNQTINSYVTLSKASSGNSSFYPNNDNETNLGTSSKKWSKIYGTEYYYGSNNVEFSTKFVTTDTAQTVSGSKNFSSNMFIYNSDNTATTPNLYLKSSKIEISSQGNTSGDQNLTWLDKNNTSYAYVKGAIQSNGSAIKIRSIAKDSSDNSVVNELQILAYTNGNKAIFPSYSNEVDLGVSSYKWKSFNGLQPSSLSLPSDRSARIDISSYFTNTGPGNTNDYSVPANGFIFLNLLNAFAVICYSIDGTNNVNYAQSYFRPFDGQIYILFPVRKNDNFRTLWTSNGGTITVTGAYFIPCLGNV